LLLTMPFVAVASLRPGLGSARVSWIRLLLLAFLAFNYTASDAVLGRLNLLEVDHLGLVGLVRDPRALVLGSLNGLALLCLFCSYLTTALSGTAVTNYRDLSVSRPEPTH
ncbi:MAG TPA: hypothetical protein VFH29_06460, partial [Anaerolineales bacterium]|nr:hypothetical protein [Anaerolineales bacterium]